MEVSRFAVLVQAALKLAKYLITAGVVIFAVAKIVPFAEVIAGRDTTFSFDVRFGVEIAGAALTGELYRRNRALRARIRRLEGDTQRSRHRQQTLPIPEEGDDSGGRSAAGDR